MEKHGFADPETCLFGEIDLLSNYYTVYDPDHSDPTSEEFEIVKPRIIYEKKALFNMLLEPFLDPHVDIDKIIEEDKRKEEERKKKENEEKLKKVLPTDRYELFNELFSEYLDKLPSSKNDDEFNSEDEYEENSDNNKSIKNNESSDDDNYEDLKFYNMKDEENNSYNVSKIELFNQIFGDIEF